jgi:hypothetical protein
MVDGDFTPNLAWFPSSVIGVPQADVEDHMSLRIVPNPVRGTASLQFSLSRVMPVGVEVYDVRGRKVSSLLDESTQSAGSHTLTINATKWSPGVYLCHVTSGGSSSVKKLLVLR